jgi:hypothetical protein
MPSRPVQSREYKVMLRPEGFGGTEQAMLKAAGAFWRDFRTQTAEVVIEAQGELDRVKTQRLITFFDTPKQLLNGSSYIFRERVDLESGKRQVTLKFRHADRFLAQDRTMDPSVAQDARTKFEEDIKAPFLSLYSFSTSLALDKASRDLAQLAHLFPDIAERVEGFRESEPLAAVNGFTARELVVEGGSLRIDKHPKVEAECALIVWYDHAGRKDMPVAVEFSYRYADDAEAYGGTTARRAFQIFNVLQTQLAKWVAPDARTKTAFVFG